MAKDAFQEFIAKTIVLEGGDKYTDTPGDRGGSTKYGVTLGTYARWAGRPATADDIKALDLPTATAIFQQLFMSGPGIDRLEVCQEIARQIYDWGVTSDPHTSIRAFQVLIGTGADGVLGPQSFTAAKAAQDKLGAVTLSNMFVNVRCAFYEHVAATNANDQQFLNGWLNRASSFRLAANAKVTPYTAPGVPPGIPLRTRAGATLVAVKQHGGAALIMAGGTVASIPNADLADAATQMDGLNLHHAARLLMISGACLHVAQAILKPFTKTTET